MEKSSKNPNLSYREKSRKKSDTTIIIVSKQIRENLELSDDPDLMTSAPIFKQSVSYNGYKSLQNKMSDYIVQAIKTDEYRIR